MREPLRLYSAIMTGWMVLLGGSAFTDLLPKVATGLLVLGTAAVKVAVDEYVRSKVTPLSDPRDEKGDALYTTRELGLASAAVGMASRGHRVTRSTPAEDTPAADDSEADPPRTTFWGPGSPADAQPRVPRQRPKPNGGARRGS